MKDISTPRISSHVVAEVTDGAASLNVQRLWMKREFITTEIVDLTPQPRPNQPRLWPLIGVYQCAFLAHATACGIPLEFVRRAFGKRFTQAAMAAGFFDEALGGKAVAFWKSEEIAAALGSGHLPEFLDDHADPDWFWMVYKRPHVPEIQLRAVQEINTAFEKGGKFDGVVLVLPITQIVDRIDARLRDAGQLEATP